MNTNEEIKAAALAEIAAARAADKMTTADLLALAERRRVAMKNAERAYGVALGRGTPDEVRVAGARLLALRSGAIVA